MKTEAVKKEELRDNAIIRETSECGSACEPISFRDICYMELPDRSLVGLTNHTHSATIMTIILYGAHRNALELHSNNLENHARRTA